MRAKFATVVNSGARLCRAWISQVAIDGDGTLYGTNVGGEADLGVVWMIKRP